MSSNELTVQDPALLTAQQEAVEDEINAALQNEVSPILVQDDLEFDPISVTRFAGTLPWNTDSKTLQCNETITDADGDSNIRLDYECTCTLNQLRTLQQMRANPNNVELVSPSYSGPVTFDQLKFERIPDANGGIRADVGPDEQPRYLVQLQTKEETEGSD